MRILVWDFPTRLFHWLLVVCLAGSWITAEAGFDYFQYHLWFGYTALGLILFRLCWGIWGAMHARFRSFVAAPTRALADLRQLWTREPVPHLGHSASGGWSVLALLALVLAQAVSGLFITDDIFYAGPYNAVVSGDVAGRLAQFHHLNFTVLQVFAALHILVILWFWLGKRQNLILPMLNGMQEVSDADAAKAASHRWVRALALAAGTALAVYLLVTLAPEPAAYF